MSFDVIFFCAVCVVLLWVTVFRKQIYPFSFYPMYSVPHSWNNVKVFRLALERKDGSVVWWCSEFYRYPEYLGRKLKRLRDSRINDMQKSTLLRLEQTRLLLIALQIIEKEEGSTEAYHAFRIVERTITTHMEPADKIIETIPLNTLRNDAY